MIRTISLFFILLSSSLLANLVLPEEFTVKQRWFSLTTTFDVETKEEVIGTVHRKFFSLLPEYQLMDPQENLLAKSNMRFLSFFLTLDVEDQNARALGVVKQKFSWIFPSFTILSPDNQKLGEAVLNFWRTKYIISDPVDEHTLITLSRPFLRLKSDWTVNIIDPIVVNEKNIHPHLLITLAAFQADIEYWEAQRRRIPINIYSAQSAQSSTLVKQLKADFRKILESYRDQLTEALPTEEDFLFVEALTDFSGSSDSSPAAIAKITQKIAEIFDLFALDYLTPEQKAALFTMLEERLISP